MSETNGHVPEVINVPERWEDAPRFNEFPQLSSRQRAFLVAYSETHNISVAAMVARVSRASHYVWIKDDTYAEAFRAAEGMAVDKALHAAWRQGVLGVEEPVYYEGQCVGYIRRLVPSMTKLLLQAFRRDEFGDRLETTVHGSVGLHPDPGWMAHLTDAEFAQLEELRRAALARANAVEVKALPAEGARDADSAA